MEKILMEENGAGDLSDIRELLDAEAARINNPSFIDEDPVQFPRRFSRLQDIEIVSFLSAIMPGAIGR